MEVILLRNVGLYDSADALVEVSEDFEQIFELLIDSSDQICHLVSFVIVLRRSLQAMLQELGDIDRVMVFMRPHNG